MHASDSTSLPPLRTVDNDLIVRTYFNGESTWQRIRAEILPESGELSPLFIDHPAYEEATAEQLLALLPYDREDPFCSSWMGRPRRTRSIRSLSGVGR